MLGQGKYVKEDELRDRTSANTGYGELLVSVTEQGTDSNGLAERWDHGDLC